MFSNILYYMSRAPTNSPQSVQSIKSQIDVLEKKRAFVESKIDEQGSIAKKAMQCKNQSSARLAMKRRMDMQKQLETIVESIMKLDTMAASIESNALSSSVANSVAIGTKLMKEQQATISVKKVDNVMLDADEALTDTQQLASAVSQPLKNGGATNDELDEELANFMAEETVDEQPTDDPLDTKMPAARQTDTAKLQQSANFPTAPQDKPKEDDGVEKELAKLAAEMAI